MIELTHASRWYGQVIGLNDITCEIGPGVTALLGQNGAGKSTMMKLITGMLRPTTGSVRVFGEEPFANASVYRRLGYCPEIDNFPEYLSGQEFLRRMAVLSGLPKSEVPSTVQRVLERVGMADRSKAKLQGYSKGMRQRIKLAQALLHEPDIILLDEPLNGLDPVGRRGFMAVLHDLAEEGKTILVSSHILFEVEQMTRSILLLHNARLLAYGDLQILRDLIDRYPHRITIETPDPRSVASHLIKLPFVLSAEVAQDDLVEVRTREPGRFYDQIPTLAVDEGIPILGLESPDNNLESVFRYLVNK